MCQLTKQEAQRFYGVHDGKPFFAKLVDFMTSGRVVAIELLAEGKLGNQLVDKPAEPLPTDHHHGSHAVLRLKPRSGEPSRDGSLLQRCILVLKSGLCT